jgi:prevent-host-death family protein
MPTVTIRALADGASRVVREVQETGRPAVITNRGIPVAAIVPLTTEQLEDWVLANLPEFVESMAEAEEDIAAGRTRSLEDVFGDDD